MLLDYIFVFVLAIALLSVGIGTYLKDRKSYSSKYFVWVIFFVVIWLLSNFFSNQTKNYQMALWTNRLIMASTSMFFWSLYAFAKNYPSRARIISKKEFNTVAFFSFIVALVGLSPFLVESVTIKENYSENIFGPGIWVYLLHTLIMLVTYVVALSKKNKLLKGIDKIKLQYFFTGLSISILGVLVTNLIFPVFFNIYALSNIGPAFLLLFVGFTAFTLVENRLFGVRYLLAQITYILLLISLPIAIFYLILLSLHTLKLNEYSGLGMLFASVSVSLLSLVSTRLSLNSKKFITGELSLGRGDIDSIRDRFAKDISTEMDIEKLNDLTIDLISDSLVVGNVAIVLIDIDKKKIIEYSALGFKEKALQLDTLLSFIPFWNEMHAGYILVKDELRHSDLTGASKLVVNALKYMESTNVELMIALNGSAQTHGFILLGQKPNAMAYTSEDLEFLTTTIADNASVAISRALLFNKLELFSEELDKTVKERTHELKLALTNLHSSQSKLELAYSELKQLDDAKSQFISMASHQLRTPVSIIRGYLSMLIDGDFGSFEVPQQVVYAKKMETNLIRLNTIIDDILNASRIEGNRFSVFPTRSDFGELVTTVIDQFQEKANKKGLKLRAKDAIDSTFIDIDKDKVFEVVSNLVDNAINYSLKGEISVALSGKKNTVLLQVKDTGIGIPADKAHEIFKKFSRMENAKSMRPDGTGIGLYLAKTIVEAHKGKIWFESVEDKGTTFFVELPKLQPKVIIPEKKPDAASPVVTEAVS